MRYRSARTPIFCNTGEQPDVTSRGQSKYFRLRAKGLLQVGACAIVASAHMHSISAQYGRMEGQKNRRMAGWKNGSWCRTEICNGPSRLPYIIIYLHYVTKKHSLFSYRASAHLFTSTIGQCGVSDYLVSFMSEKRALAGSYYWRLVYFDNMGPSESFRSLSTLWDLVSIQLCLVRML